MTTIREPQPIIEILSRVALELNDLAKSVDHLHSLVESIDHGCVAQKDAFMHTAQSIDIVEQRLSSLSHFISELGELIPSHWEVLGHAAAQKLTLSALAHRLSTKGAHDFQTNHPTGDLEFF